ncbi:MAG: hypothetical protein ACMXYG_04460 [Candidatus Woesearchaeota archaeon]
MSKYSYRSYTCSGGKGSFKLNQDMKYVDYRKNIAIIADGVSQITNKKKGTSSGRQAAFQAICWASYELNSLYRHIHSGRIDESDISLLLGESLKFVNETVVALGNNISDFSGLATTLDACLIHNDVAYIAHVGDSRVYHITYDRIGMNLLTNDHSDCNVDLSDLEGDHKKVVEMKFSPLYNWIGKKEISVDVVTQEMKKGDILFMTTDGLLKRLYEKSIYHSLRSNPFNTHLVKDLKRRLKKVSDYAKADSLMCNCPLEQSDKKFKDDITFIAIQRRE